MKISENLDENSVNLSENLHEKAINLDKNLSKTPAKFPIVRSLTNSPIKAHFSKNSDDFIVREAPLYAFSGSGEHLILHIAKKDLTTHEAVRILSAKTGAKMREFGFAGLKDKQGATFQHISLPKIYEPKLSNFSHEKMKILDTFLHNNKLKIGHLRGNSFFVRLKKMDKTSAKRLKNAFESLVNQGFANYFGEQRFGKFGDNFAQGLEILRGKSVKNPKLHDFLLSAFQSELFNRYLAKRVEISHFARDFSEAEFAKIYALTKSEAKEIYAQKQFFKVLRGEVLGHYPYGKCFICEDLQSENERFLRREISPLGLLLGKKAFGFDLNLVGLGGENLVNFGENSANLSDKNLANFSDKNLSSKINLVNLSDENLANFGENLVNLGDKNLTNLSNEKLANLSEKSVNLIDENLENLSENSSEIQPKNPNFAQKIENEIFAEFVRFTPKLNGARRYLWGFLENAKCKYDEQNAHFILEFFLQKGSYATTILSELGVEV